MTSSDQGLFNFAARVRDPVWEESWDSEKMQRKNHPLFGCLIISPTYFPLNRNSCNFNDSRCKIQTCLLNSAFHSLINITSTQNRTIHSQAQYKLHNTRIYKEKNYTCNAHYMQACDHIHNKYFNWLALNMIQHINTWLSLKQGTGNRGWEWGVETGNGNLRRSFEESARNDRGIFGE